MNSLWTFCIVLILFNIVPTLQQIRDELRKSNQVEEQQCPKPQTPRP